MPKLYFVQLSYGSSYSRETIKNPIFRYVVNNINNIGQAVIFGRLKNRCCFYNNLIKSINLLYSNRFCFLPEISVGVFSVIQINGSTIRIRYWNQFIAILDEERSICSFPQCRTCSICSNCGCCIRINIKDLTILVEVNLKFIFQRFIIIKVRLTGPINHHRCLVNVQSGVFIDCVFSFIRKLLSQQEFVVIKSRLPAPNSYVSNGENCLIKSKYTCNKRVNWRVRVARLC